MMNLRLQTRTPLATLTRGVAGVAAAALLVACSGNSFDAAQVPRITVTPVVGDSVVTISWVPAGAALIRVYRGTVADQGNSPNLVWSVTATGLNTLVSPLRYGVTPPPGGTTDVPAQALRLGQPYTVQVSRQDPKAGPGDGFTSTGFRYVQTQTFTIASVQ